MKYGRREKDDIPNIRRDVFGRKIGVLLRVVIAMGAELDAALILTFLVFWHSQINRATYPPPLHEYVN